jgi:hypothetical protein
MPISPIKLPSRARSTVEKTTANAEVTFTGEASFLEAHLPVFADPACKIVLSKTNKESKVTAVTVSGPFDKLSRMDKVLSDKPNAISLYSGFTTPVVQGRLSEVAFKNLDEVMTEGSPKLALLARWIKRHIGFVFAQNGFTMSSILTADNPISVVFERPRSNADDAQAIVEMFENALGLTFKKGLEGGYSPFARVSNSFNADANYVYLVITLWSSGKLTVKIAGH